jgi:hypothetical protein
MTAETIHTCSYSCERPECIRAQRDELVSRLEALTAAQQQQGQPAAADGAYPTPRNRAEAVALARLALAYLGVIDAHIDAAAARCETDLAAQPQGDK